jgi:hypothetical protein
LPATSGEHNVEELEPSLDLARQKSHVAHDVVVRFKEMGLPERFDRDLASLSTDLGDLWAAQKTLSDQVESLLKSATAWQDVGELLADVRSSVDHIAWHMKSVRRPLNRIATYAYRAANEGLGTGNVR